MVVNLETSYAVRPAVKSDFPTLVKLINSAYRGESGRIGWTTESDLLLGQRIDIEMLSEISNLEKNVVLVAQNQCNEVVGCVHVKSDESYESEVQCYLGLLTVDVHLQSRGVGKILLESAENFAKTEFHTKSMKMQVISVRSELIAWYIKNGYCLTGETIPFPYGNLRFGQPLRDDLMFVVLVKSF